MRNKGVGHVANDWYDWYGIQYIYMDTGVINIITRAFPNLKKLLRTPKCYYPDLLMWEGYSFFIYKLKMIVLYSM
jgi:hypothetical protein